MVLYLLHISVLTFKVGFCHFEETSKFGSNSRTPWNSGPSRELENFKVDDDEPVWQWSSEPASISMARGGTPRTPLPSSAACLAVLPLVVRAAALVSLIGGCSRRCVHAAAHIETGLVSVPVIARSFTKTGLRVFSFKEAAIFQRGGSMSRDGDGTSRCDASDASHVGSPLMPDVPSPLSRQLHCPGEFFPLPLDPCTHDFLQKRPPFLAVGGVPLWQFLIWITERLSDSGSSNSRGVMR